MPLPNPIAAVAGELYDAFETATRPDETTFVRLRDDADHARWSDIVRTVHGEDRLPDDWRFRVIRDIAGAIPHWATDDPEAEVDDLIDLLDPADVYHAALLAWLQSALRSRMTTVDDVLGEYGADIGLASAIQRAQELEAREIAGRLIAELTAAAPAADTDDG